MQTVLEIYENAIRPLSPNDQIKLASLILDRVSETNGKERTEKNGGDISQFFGMFDSGHPNGADNEQIDRDLEGAYLEDFERSKS